MLGICVFIATQALQKGVCRKGGVVVVDGVAVVVTIHTYIVVETVE